MNFNEYQELISIINHHMDLYYNNDVSEISDYEYDQLMIKLKEAEKIHPEWVSKESPTQKIGGVAKREAGVKVEHDVPMLSIEDVFTKEDVALWVNKVKNVHPDAVFSVETKIDGLSMTLRYEKAENGLLKLVMAETRGDGFIGEDVTQNALVIPDIKEYMNLPYDSLQLRGEVYMSLDDFEKFNLEQEKQGKKLAANPRNLAAGTLRQLDSKVTKERGLKMFVFNVQKGTQDLMNSHCDGLDILSSEIPVVFHKKCVSVEEILNTIDEIGERRGEYGYDIDGAVVKIDQVSYRNDFPTSSKYSSGHIAYKYPPEEKIVVMDDIIVDVGRTGKLTYTGVCHDRDTGKAARLCGTYVSRVTLHNQDYINTNQVGLLGEYKIYKSGEIIPKLNGCVNPPPRIFVSPSRCPVCGGKLENEIDTADIRCNNSFCGSQLVRTITYFCSIDAMNIIGLGESIIEELIKYEYIKNYSDIYRLQFNKLKLLEDDRLEKIGKSKNIEKILSAIEKSKENDPVKLITGLGIREVGKNTAKALIKAFGSIEKIQNATVEELIAIEDIGETIALSISEFFSKESNRNIIKELAELGLNMTQLNDTVQSDKLSGLTIVVTGTLPTLGRKEVTDLIENNGGKCTGSVSKKTNYVVVGEDAGSKLTKAQQLGIPTISEEQLLAMINS